MKTDEFVKNLPAQAKALWAKTPNKWGFGRNADADDADLWLPLYMHMADCAEVAKRLWETWIPDGVKESIHGDAAFARRLFVFLAAAHDLGKATPGFQQKSESLAAYCKLFIPHMSNPNKIRHGLAGHRILTRHAFDESVAVVLGGHHGKPPSCRDLLEIDSYAANTGFKSTEWLDAQDALFEYACALSGASAKELRQTVLAPHAQALLTGLVIMTDWIASDESRFAYISLLQFRPQSSVQRASSAWDGLRLSARRETRMPLRDADAYFRARFGVESPRPIQTAVFRALSEAKNPGIVVIEAPMGEGKTEAALAAAEKLMEKSGRGGVFVGLPTMATSDGMFGRVKSWVDALGKDADANLSMYLAHGKAMLNDAYAGLSTEPNVGDDGEENVIVNDWFQGRKKGVLADFVVGTVDQLLFMALKMRHVALRHLAFACKAVIIDECHSYDAYMNKYLHRALEWLGKYRTPVVVLSATLPCAARQKLVEAYLGVKPAPPAPETPVWKLPAGAPPAPPKKAAPPPEWAARTDYPMITYSDGDAIKQTAPPPSGRPKSVTFEYLPDGALPDKLQELLSEGGCAGIVLDTVGRAQETMRILGERFAGTDIELIHSRFLSVDRMQKEKALRDKLGPPGRAGRRPERLIVVGTQILEQSLDISFDLLVSDIAPMDLLLQRVGRLHRHARARPAKLEEARCFITGVEDASEWKFAQSIEKIYSRYALLNTLLLLPVSPRSVTLPDDISPLVQAAYAETAEGDAAPPARSAGLSAREKAEAAMREEKRATYAEARKAHNERINRKEEKANVFRLMPPAGAAGTLVDWLDIAKSDGDERKAEAAVRDTSDSIEVMVVQKKADGKIFLLPWVRDASKGVAPGAEIPTERVPKDAVARVAAACTVSLPMLLCRSSRIIDDVIAELESKAIASRVGRWQESFWLRGMLPLILDENLQTEILGHTVSYCDKTGLSVTRKETGTGT